MCMNKRREGKQMKIMKRLAAALLAAILVCPCFSNLVFAQDGLAFFTDLETSVGEEFTVTGTVVDKTTGVLGEVTVEIKYDPEYMTFVDGDDGVKGKDGVVTFTGSGDGSSDRLTFDMTFQALKEGDTQLDQISADVTSGNGTTLTDFTMGYSAIKIAEGDASNIKGQTGNAKADFDSASGTVKVGDTSYVISEDFSESQIPEGYTASEFTYNGETYKGAAQSGSGVVVAYLVDSSGKADFFIFNESKNVFYPYEEIMISDTYSIVVLDGTDEVKMPEKYTVTDIQINEVNFPVWQEPDREGFYIFYALNSEGTKALYLYDSVEHTYQRMETPKTAKSEGNDVSGMDKMLGNVEDHLIWFMVGMGCALVVLIAAVVVLAVKLKHRNLELDDLYDEYGIDVDHDASKKEKDYFEGSDLFASKDLDFMEDDRDDPGYGEDYNYGHSDYHDEAYDYDDYADEDEYDYDDDYGDYGSDYDDYGYDDEDYDDYEDDYYEEQDFAPRHDTVGMKMPERNNYDSYYDEEDYEYDDYAMSSAYHAPKADTFEMDFIDL